MGRRGFFPHKSIYWLDFEILIASALSNLTGVAVKFLTEDNYNFHLRFATFWLHYKCVFACL